MSTDTKDAYTALVEDSALIAADYLERHPSLQFIFNMKSHDDVDTDLAFNKPAQKLVALMDPGNHSLSTMNMTFTRIVRNAIDAGRPVETRRGADGQLRVYIKPPENTRSQSSPKPVVAVA